MINNVTICLIVASLLMTHMVKGQELSWDDEKISLYKNNAKHTLMNAESIFEERWDELAQAQFWQKIMLLSPDSCIVNVASSRQILSVIPVIEWAKKSEIEKAILITTRIFVLQK